MVSLTATRNSTLPLCRGEFETIAEGLEYARRGETGCNFFSSRGDLVEALTYGEIRDRAIDLALAFDAAKLERGGRLAIIAETTPDFLIFFYACQYAGLVPVPLPLSVNLGGHDSYVGRLHNMMERARVVGAVASSDLIGYLREAAEGLDIGWLGTPEDFFALPRSGGDLRPLCKDEPCYVQYSSGSTSSPRGVLVTQRAITSNARAIVQHGLDLREGDRAVSWLPLYHDMGLVGFCLAPIQSQVTIDYMASTTFARRPMLWLKILSEHGGTISFSPTFGYELCTRLSSRVGPGQFDLSRWRVAGIGGEMVRPSVLRDFAERFADCGFAPRAFLPSYGLAESTLAVSFSPLDEGVRVDRISREAYTRKAIALPAKKNGNGETQDSRSFVRCGAPLPGHRIEIRDETNRALPERRIGWVCIEGPSLMQGYFSDEQATAAAFTPDGWLNTGDMGYLVDGDLVITGRSKDLIICNGRNIWPQDLEWAVESQCELRPGDVAAFSVDDEEGKERVVVVVETRAKGPEAHHELRRQVSAVITTMAGVIGEVVLAAPRSLTFTSSGKLSRVSAKADFLSGAIEDVGTDPAGPRVPEPALPLAATAGE
jgi:fatty-acyl-CoA synthase